MQREYLAQDWQETLAANQLNTFERLWNVPQNWIEPPNQRRHGWSGVTKLTLTLTDGSEKVVFLKRQSNHFCKTWQSPRRGIPTFAREAKNLLRWSADFPTQTLIYYGQRGVDAILVTENLAGFISLAEFLNRPAAQIKPYRYQIIEQLATLLRQMHAKGVQHTALYPKHIFINIMPGHQVELRLIDLESMRFKLFPSLCRFRDLDTLNRHLPTIAAGEKIRFLKKYLNISHLNSRARVLIKKLKKQYIKKV